MAVVEFALDSTAQHRVQVHLSAEQPASVTVLLNRSVLGSLAPEEQEAGKDFRLPNNSLLHVCVINGQPQLSLGGYPLPPLDAIAAKAKDVSPAALAQERNKKLGGCLVAWLIVNLVIIGVLAILYFLAIFGAMATGMSPLPFMLFSLLCVVGLVGISLIFFWKKIGFYLTAAYVVLSLLLSIPFGLLDARSLIPLVAIAMLFVYLNRSGVWDKMR